MKVKVAVRHKRESIPSTAFSSMDKLFPFNVLLNEIWKFSLKYFVCYIGLVLASHISPILSYWCDRVETFFLLVSESYISTLWEMGIYHFAVVSHIDYGYQNSFIFHYSVFFFVWGFVFFIILFFFFWGFFSYYSVWYVLIRKSHFPWSTWWLALDHIDIFVNP